MKKLPNCEFCKNILKFSHTENVKEVDVYDCVKCQVLVSFYFYKTGERTKTCYMFHRNGKPYMWTNNYLNRTSYITNLQPDDKDPMILKFPKIMPLTPSNLLEKFSFYMVFL